MYQKAIVTFIDILGFGDLVKKSDYGSVKKVLDAVEKTTSPITFAEQNGKEDLPEVVSFSDAIVRVRKFESDTNKRNPFGVLFYELVSLVHAQSELMDIDIIIRGSVTIGDIYISEGRVFGPALVDAYGLENKYADYPRIIIDPKLIREYKTNTLLRTKGQSLRQELEIVGNLLRQGDDGIWFVDYARGIEAELNAPERYFAFLKKHRDVILNQAKSQKVLNAVLSKFIWMAYYHNQIVSDISEERFENYGLRRKDFFINSDEMPTLQYVVSCLKQNSNTP
jgi:hypothetical protein